MSTSAFTLAARALLDHEQGRLPDLSDLVVLVPHHAAAQSLSAALAEVLAGRVILPPQLLTLPAFAHSLPGRPQPEPNSAQLADVYSFLRRFGGLQARQLWPVAAELAGLLRELTDNMGSLPADFASFQQQLEAAYRRKLGMAMSLEAKLAHELWHAMQRSQRPDVGRDYAERLALLAERASLPLYHVELPGLSAVERAFMKRYAERQPVRALPLPVPHPERAALLETAWGQTQSGAVDAVGQNAAGSWLTLMPADSLENEARIAELQVRQWLSEGYEHVGVIALDRVAARRLRALLERRSVLVQDETGWTFSTAAVSHVLDRWFALLQDDCYYRDLLDFLKSPYVFADLPEEEVQAAVAAIELALRRQAVVEGWQRFHRMTHELDLPLAGMLLDRMQLARTLFGGGRAPLFVWQQRLFQAFDILGVTPALEVDWAGQQLLAMLRQMGLELEGGDTAYRFAEWRQWLMLQLDQATFVDTRVDSPVRFTHLRAARMREFEAVLILGSDAAHLPESGRPGLFGQAARMELGLPDQRERELELQAALVDVLARTPKVVAMWQALRGGEPVPLSPWLETLDLWHRGHFGRGLRQTGIAYDEPIDELAALTQAAAADVLPKPASLAARVTVSAWQSLVSCPYRYYARHLLGLNELDEVPEEMDKRDYGTLIHAALAKFHENRTSLLNVDRLVLEQELAAAVDAVFAEAGHGQFLAEAWRVRWHRRQTAYLDWAVDWERQGYRFVKAEAQASLAVAVGEVEVKFEGRLDRLDHGPDGLVVLDYKTNAAQTLRNKLKQAGEDVQLPSYAWLTGAAEAGFVALDEGKVAWLAWKEGLSEAAEAEAVRFADTFEAIAAGAGMPAHGASSVCRHCEMRGLCRQEHQREN